MKPPSIRRPATSGINVLSLGHMYIIVLIFLGNLAFFLTRQSQKED